MLTSKQLTLEELIGPVVKKEEEVKSEIETRYVRKITGSLLREYYFHEDEYVDHEKSIQRFLGQLCLYLLAHTKRNYNPMEQEPDPNLADYFPDSDDRIFVEHFIFHNIPKEKFIEEIAIAPNDQKKVKTFCKMIKDKFGDERSFRNYHTNNFELFCRSPDVVKPRDDQKKLYCRFLFPLIKNDYFVREHIAPMNHWVFFIAACKRVKLDFSEGLLTQPVIGRIDKKITKLQKELDGINNKAIKLEVLLKIKAELKPEESIAEVCDKVLKNYDEKQKARIFSGRKSRTKELLEGNKDHDFEQKLSILISKLEKEIDRRTSKRKKIEALKLIKEEGSKAGNLGKAIQSARGSYSNFERGFFRRETKKLVSDLTKPGTYKEVDIKSAIETKPKR